MIYEQPSSYSVLCSLSCNKAGWLFSVLSSLRSASPQLWQNSTSVVWYRHMSTTVARLFCYRDTAKLTKLLHPLNLPFLFWTLQVTVQQLRERLSRALGQQPVAPAAPAQTQRAQPQPSVPTQAPRQHPFTPTQPAMVPQPPAAAAAAMPSPVASAPAQPQYYQPVCSSDSYRST